MKTAPLILLATSLLAQTPLNVEVDRTQVRFFWEAGPFIEGEDIVLTWHFNYRTCKTCTFYLRLCDESMVDFYFQITEEYDFSSYSGEIYDGAATIPGSYVNGEKAYLSFGVYGIQAGVSTHGDWGDYCTLTQDVVKPYGDSYLYLKSSTELDTGKTYVYSGVRQLTKYRNYYNFYEDYQTKKIQRSIGISNMRLSHTLENGKSPSISSKIELRMLDHLDYFEQFGTRYGVRKNGYVSIPVILSRDFANGDSTTYFYKPQTKEIYRVSCSNYRFEPLGPGNEFVEPTFSIRDICIPLGIGYDNDKFRYQLFLWTVPNLPPLVISRTIDFGDPPFGNCDSAQYCVVVGK